MGCIQANNKEREAKKRAIQQRFTKPNQSDASSSQSLRKHMTRKALY